MNRKLGDIYVPRAVPVGTKIWFGSKRYGYTVRASNTAFAVLTRPFNIEKTVLYTIIDWELGIRGPSNLIFNIGDLTLVYEHKQVGPDDFYEEVNDTKSDFVKSIMKLVREHEQLLEEK